jgi:hypothetical protein
MTPDQIEDSIVTAVQYVHAANMTLRARNMLGIWTIFDHPDDFPETFVARLFEGITPTIYIVAGDLPLLRECMMRSGLTYMARTPGDDAYIVETWWP